MCKLRNKLISSMLACKMHVWIIKQNDCLHVHDKSSVCTLVCKLHVCLLKKGLFARASCATNWLFDTCMQIARVDRKISDCLHVQVARQIDCLYPAGSADRLPCQSARSDIPAFYLPSCTFIHTIAILHILTYLHVLTYLHSICHPARSYIPAGRPHCLSCHTARAYLRVPVLEHIQACTEVVIFLNTRPCTETHPGCTEVVIHAGAFHNFLCLFVYVKRP